MRANHSKTNLFIKRNALWFVFAIFASLVIIFHDREGVFISQSTFPMGKLIFWGLFVAFFAYSYHCSLRENIFKTIKIIYPYYWARPIYWLFNCNSNYLFE